MNERYRTGLRRLVAAILDFMLMAAPSIAIWANTSLGPTAQTVLDYVDKFLPLVYSVLLHCWFGQTFGKKIMGVKVLDVSEVRLPSFRQALLRDSVWLGLEMLGVLLALIGAATLAWLEQLLANAALLWLLLEMTTLLLNAKRRAVHDLIAGTVVVRE